MGASHGYFRALLVIEEQVGAEEAPPLGEAEDRLFRAAVTRLAAQPGLVARPWGSAFDEDPWPAQLPESPHPALDAALRERFGAQAEGRPPSLSFRSTSGSCVITVEDHLQDVVLAVRWPAAVGATTNRVTELPSETQAALAGLELRTADALLGAVEGELAMALVALRGLAAVWYDDLALLPVLRRLQAHPDWQLRGAVIAAAQRLGHRLFLHELCAAETHVSLRRILETCTAHSEAAVPAA